MQPKIAQSDVEFSQFTALLAREQVKSYLEIGSQYGGSLWQAANALPIGSRIVSVDKPNGTTQASLDECVKDLVDLGYEVHSFIGDSNRHDIVSAVARLAPFDACFIDANHTLPYCTADWQNYGAMSRIVAFHDIAWLKETRVGRLPIEVPTLWRSIKDGYRHLEIREREDQSENGIGVLWRS